MSGGGPGGIGGAGAGRGSGGPGLRPRHLCVGCGGLGWACEACAEPGTGGAGGALRPARIWGVPGAGSRSLEPSVGSLGLSEGSAGPVVECQEPAKPGGAEAPIWTPRTLPPRPRDACDISHLPDSWVASGDLPQNCPEPPDCVCSVPVGLGTCDPFTMETPTQTSRSPLRPVRRIPMDLH